MQTQIGNCSLLDENFKIKFKKSFAANNLIKFNTRTIHLLHKVFFKEQLRFQDEHILHRNFKIHFFPIMIFDCNLLNERKQSSVGEQISVMDPYTTRHMGSRSVGYGTISTELLTNNHHISIIKLSIWCCVWKVGKGFHNRIPETLKWVVVYSSVKFTSIDSMTGRPGFCIL